MGNKLLWLGLTLVEAADFVPTAVPAVKLVGVVIMAVGCILYFSDK
jgi:hypothetical protein